MIGSMIKAPKDKNTYFFLENGREEYRATNATLVWFSELLSFRPNQKESFFKTDTVYFDRDTLINSMSCKKVAINYITSYINEQRILLPYDTIKYTYFVSPDIKTLTPMSFASKKLKGLIIKSVKDQMQYSVIKGFLEKKVARTEILSSIRKVANKDHTYFKLPDNCKYYKDVEEIYSKPI